MEFDNLIKLINTVSKSELTAFQYEEKGIKVKMGKEKGTISAVEPVLAGIPKAAQIQGMAVTEDTIQAADSGTGSTESENVKIVVSPLVGTFYAAPAEGGEAFVSVGDAVTKGQTLAIVEAMKLMNEIESEFDGIVEEILVENGQPVEYNQPLFRLK